MTDLRSQGLNLAIDSTDRKLDAKIKNATKGGAKWAIFIGEQELASGKFKLKNLESGEEKELPSSQIAARIKV